MNTYWDLWHKTQFLGFYLCNQNRFWIWESLVHISAVWLGVPLIITSKWLQFKGQVIVLIFAVRFSIAMCQTSIVHRVLRDELLWFCSVATVLTTLEILGNLLILENAGKTQGI